MDCDPEHRSLQVAVQWEDGSIAHVDAATLRAKPQCLPKLADFLLEGWFAMAAET